MKFMKVIDRTGDEEETIAYINPATIICITPGRMMKSDPGSQDIYDYETVIYCRGGNFFGLNIPLETVKAEIEKLTDTYVYVDPDGNVIPIS